MLCISEVVASITLDRKWIGSIRRFFTAFAVGCICPILEYNFFKLERRVREIYTSKWPGEMQPSIWDCTGKVEDALLVDERLSSSSVMKGSSFSTSTGDHSRGSQFHHGQGETVTNMLNSSLIPHEAKKLSTINPSDVFRATDNMQTSDEKSIPAHKEKKREKNNRKPKTRRQKTEIKTAKGILRKLELQLCATPFLCLFIVAIQIYFAVNLARDNHDAKLSDLIDSQAKRYTHESIDLGEWLLPAVLAYFQYYTFAEIPKRKLLCCCAFWKTRSGGNELYSRL